MTSDDDPGDHLEAWARLHRTQAPAGFVAWWLRASAAVARPLVRAGVSPNAVTVAAMVLGVVAFPLAALDGWVGPAVACAAVALSGLLDSLDGAVAVQAGRTTRVGFLLDSALDRVADAAFPAALAVVAAGRGTAAATAAALAVAAGAAGWYLEYVRARASLAEASGVDREGPRASGPARQMITPGERPTRIILTAVGLGLPPLALAALVAQLVIVGGSAIFLLGHSLSRLRLLDGHGQGSGDPAGRPPGPTG